METHAHGELLKLQSFDKSLGSVRLHYINSVLTILTINTQINEEIGIADKKILVFLCNVWLN